MRSNDLWARAREIRSRAAIRSWELRQIPYARGVWFRLAYLLALTRSAWVISEGDARMLEAQGHDPHPVGLQFEPPRKLFVIPEGRIPPLGSAREIPLRIGLELLSAPALILVPFEDPREI